MTSIATHKLRVIVSLYIVVQKETTPFNTTTWKVLVDGAVGVQLGIIITEKTGLSSEERENYNTLTNSYYEKVRLRGVHIRPLDYKERPKSVPKAPA